MITIIIAIFEKGGAAPMALHPPRRRHIIASGPIAARSATRTITAFCEVYNSGLDNSRFFVLHFIAPHIFICVPLQRMHIHL